MERKISEIIGEKLIDLANIAAGAMIFGRLVAGDTWQWWIIALGFVIVVGLYITGSLLIQWGR